MNLQKINPWNWFKHEQGGGQNTAQVPVTRLQENTSGAPEYRDQLPIFRLHREMDRLFEDIWKSFGSSFTGLPGDGFGSSQTLNLVSPRLDVSGTGEQYDITLDVPGLTEAELAIEVKDDVLTIKGHKEQSAEDKNKEYYRVERMSGSFQRTLSLPDDANKNDIKANLKEGVLTISIPRLEVSQRDVKRIAIN